MAIIARTHIPDGDASQSDDWNQRVSGVLAGTPGFILQVDGPAAEGGWQLVSVWESEADLTRFFESAVKPYLPPEAQMAQTISKVRVIRPAR